MEKYPKLVHEFIKLRLEQTENNTQIARDVKNKFVFDVELDAIRRTVSDIRQRLKIQAKQIPIKRLFFDIETGYYILKQRVWQLKNYQKYFNPDDIIKEKEILCISYKWQYEDVVHTLDNRKGEKEMLKEFVRILGEADEIIGHNGEKFDIRFIRTRCFFHGVLMFPDYRSLDTLKKSRNSFLFASNKLDYLGKFSGIGGKKEHEGMQMWIDIVEGDKETADKALNRMIEYCERDVILLEDYFHILSPFITHNNNFAVLTGNEKWHCPECASKEVSMYRTYTTAMGVVRRNMKCNCCKKQYKISNKTYMHMILDMVNTNNKK